MTSLRRGAFRSLIALPVAALVLTSCESDPSGQDGPLGGGSLGQSVSDTELAAPAPTGNQLSHEQMREALEEHASGTITDTDDWFPHLRDLSRELQMLRVRPTDCKPYVTSSALPVPTGALGALAEGDSAHTVIYTFTDSGSAESYLESEREGMELCEKHTVTRDLADTEVEATTELTELEVRSGAEDALAVRQVMETDGTAQSHLAVVLRQGAHLVLAAVPEDEGTEEESIIEAEATAARILSDLVGEEITVPEPEPEEDDKDEDSGTDEDSSTDGDSAEEDNDASSAEDSDE